MDGPKQGNDLTAADSKQGYVVVARRYRPQSFGDLVGQNSISRALSNAILSNRVGYTKQRKRTFGRSSGPQQST